MKLEFTREERIANALMLHAFSLEDCGLLHGKMGIALYLHHLARSSGKPAYSEFATELIDNITESLHVESPVDFAKGITGIGWAVEHLIRNGFVDADADEVLEDFDARIKNVLVYSDCSLETLLSIGYYYVSRICYRASDEQNMQLLELKFHSVYLIDMLERTMWEGGFRKEAAMLLDELHQLDIFNFKVEKIREALDAGSYSFLIPFVPIIPPDRVHELLGSSGIESPYAGFDLSAVPDEERWGIRNGIAGIGLQKILAT